MFHTVISKWKKSLKAFFSGESNRQILISIFSLAASGLFATALRFVGSIIQGRFIGPETLGYYTQFTILPGYMFFLHLGVFTSFARQYPYFIGKEDQPTAFLYAGNALGWTLVLIAVHAFVFAALSMVSAIRGDWNAALGWGTQILVSFATLYMFYLGTTYRNSGDFVQWSKATILSSIASLLLLPFVVFYQFLGLCLRYSAPEIISSVYAHIKRPIKPAPLLNRGVLLKMMAFGAPLMVFTYTSTNLWIAVERTYILQTMNERALGLFAFAGALAATLVTVARSISQVFHPRIAMLYGSSGKNMKECFRYCVKCTMAGTAMMLPLILISLIFIKPVVEWVLPKYLDCVPVFRSLCWLALIPVIDLPKQLLIVAKKTWPFGFSVMAGFLGYSGILWINFKTPGGMALDKLAAFSVLGQMISVAVSFFLAWLSSRQKNYGL